MIIRLALFAGAVAAMTLSTVLPAATQAFPVRTVRLIVAYAPGGTGDIVARLIAQPLGLALGQNVVVENRAGATGSIGAQAVASAPPDGHTLLMGQTGEIAVNKHWIANLGYDPQSLVAVALASVVPLALVVPATSPYARVDDLAAALADGKALTFASAGTGTPGHFAGEFLKLHTRANLTHVPYKGAGPALNDLIGSHVDMYFPGFPAVAPLLKTGAVRILAVSSATRSSAAPQIPTVAEAIGNPDFEVTLWQGVFAPAATPGPVVERLNAEINRILASPGMQDKLREAGADVRIGTQAQFAAFARAESDKYAKIIQAAGAVPGP